MIVPSGAQIEIVADGQRAEVVEVGGGPRSYSSDRREFVDGYGDHEMSSSGRGQVPISSVTRTAWHESSSKIQIREHGFRSGSTRITPI